MLLHAFQAITKVCEGFMSSPIGGAVDHALGPFKDKLEDVLGQMGEEIWKQGA